MRRKLKWIGLFLFIGILIFQGIRAYDRRNAGFEIEKIYSQEPYTACWDLPVTTAEIAQANTILSQPFYYLGHGFQAYAFLSADGKYVLKFFRYQRLRLPECARFLPDWQVIRKIKMEKEEEFAMRKQFLFGGIKVGYESAKDETAMVFVHLNKTKDLHGKTKIFDKLGNCYVLEMDNMEFMLQLRADLIKPVIDDLMAEERVDEAKRRIDQIYEFMASCAKKGIGDTDGALVRKNNLGFLDDRVIYIDSGKLMISDITKKKSYFAKDLRRLRPLEKWFKERYPALGAYCDVKKEKVLNEF